MDPPAIAQVEVCQTSKADALKTLGDPYKTGSVDVAWGRLSIDAVVGGTARSPADQEAVAADGRAWRAVSDGSLSGYRNAEIVSPVLAYEDIAEATVG